MRKWIALVAAAIGLGTPAAASAEWHYAESKHFRVYADDTAEATKGFASELERLNEAMMIVSGNFGKKEDLPTSSKVTVYRFGETSDIGALIGPGSNVAGFFIPRAGDSIAVVPRRDDNARGLGAKKSPFALNPRAILFHEYTHYFMFQHGAAAYPAWYVEGFAELFSTLQLNPESFTLGEVPTHRGYELSEFKIKLRSLLDPPKKLTAEDVYRTYSIGWLLTSHLTFDPARKGQLGKYLRLYNSGATPLAAAEQAFGDLDVLEKELDKYRRSSARLLKVPFATTQAPVVDIRALRPDESARMMMMVHSKKGVTEERAKKQIPDARALVGRFPDSVPVLVAAAEVEFDAGNLDEAEKLANRALAINPRSLDAAIYLAYVSMKRGEKDKAHYASARSRFIAANKLETDHPVPLAGYYLSYVMAGEEPPEAAVASLEGAFSHAPFDPNLRRTTAHMLLLQNRDQDAKIVLAPLVNGAHARGGDKLRDALTKLEAGERAPLLEMLRPKTSEEMKKEAEREEAEAKKKGKVDKDEGDGKTDGEAK